MIICIVVVVGGGGGGGVLLTFGNINMRRQRFQDVVIVANLMYTGHEADMVSSKCCQTECNYNAPYERTRRSPRRCGPVANHDDISTNTPVGESVLLPG